MDNVGEVSNIVKSNVLPLTMIEWSCMPQRFHRSEMQDLDGRSGILEHAVETDDMEMLQFLIEIGADQQALAAEEDDDQTSYSISQSVFSRAIKLGRTTMLAEMIRVSP